MIISFSLQKVALSALNRRVITSALIRSADLLEELPALSPSEEEDPTAITQVIDQGEYTY